MYDPVPLPQRIAGRYRVERSLGMGGMSRVLEVVDERDGRRLALKQLLPSSQSSRQVRTLALFRQEFHVLTQIAHPNVVVVDEYGFDGAQPFYTMELVSGRSLEALAPLGHKQLCSILLDLCSPLSLLHARRFVHSDITARNVLVSERGVTKLIDFGALTPIDVRISTIAGTPPYMAPELVDRQLLDGRVDIFALGALAYFALSGRHAYPARSLRELHELWTVAPSSLTELGVAIPAALDHLIMSMLSLDSAARPVQIAELVQRLCAISGESELDRGTISTHAATPRLIAREPLIETFRSLQESAAQGSGELLCISGGKGSGRSRALDACALEARLSGSLVLRASAEQAVSVDLGMFASVLHSALRQAPELTPLLGAGLPSGAGSTEAELVTFLPRPDARALLDTWWDELTAQRVVVLLVDDLARADRPSVQQLLLLAEASKRRRLLIVVCAGTGESGLERELKPLLKMGCTAKLRPLSLVETELLLRSMFGDMPQMDALASWVHSAAAGIPAACVELAHYALARGVVCHRSGQFQVAGDLALLELPAAYDDAIAARVRALSPQAREALGALALLTPFGPLSDPEHIELFANAAWTQAQALAALDELRDAQLLRARYEGYELHSEAVRRVAKAELGADGIRYWHERIGSFYQTRGHARGMLAALHLEYAGERQRAYDQLLPLDANIEGPEDPNIPLGGSALGIALHQAMLAHAVAIKNRVDVLHFRRILLELASTTNPSLGSDGLDLLQELRIDAGLDFWEQAPSEYSEQQKIFYCLAHGHERHLTTPAEERGLPVADAVRILAQSASVVAGICGSTFDRVTATELLRIFEPLRTLAPVLALTYQMLEYSMLAFTQGGNMTERWNECLTLFETRPEGMRELIWRYVISNLQCAIAREAALRGDPSYQVHAANLGQQRRRETQVLSLHLLFALAHGRFDQSKRLRKEVEISALASRHEDQTVAFARIDELELLEACGDLLELQRLSQWFDARARRYPGWLPFAAYARAAGLLLCDQPQAAEAVVAAQLEAAPVLQHGAWYALRALRAEAILHAGNAALAKELAEEIVRQAAAAEVDVSPNTRAQRVLALASAALGDAASAHAILEPSMREAESGISVRAGQVLEARARVALFCSDRATFQRCLARVREIYSQGGYPGLIARLERLQAAGRRAFEGQVEPSAAERYSMLSDRSAAPYQGLQLELERLDPTERALYLLTMLLADCGASAGKLYHVSAAGAVSLVQVQLAVLDESVIDDGVSDYVSRITALNDETTFIDMDGGPEATLVSSTLLADDMAYTVVALRDRSGALRGVALVRADSRAAKPTCSPELCVSVATALGSWF